LTVVGITNEQEDVVLPFVEKQGSKISYRLALDTENSAYSNLMRPNNATGIPSVFLLFDNTVEFYGHPFDPELESHIQEVLTKAKPKRQVPLPLILDDVEALMKRPVKELKEILHERGISTLGLAEKKELADKIVETCSTITYYKDE